MSLLKKMFDLEYKKKFICITVMMTMIYVIAMVLCAITSVVDYFAKPWFWGGEYIVLIYPVFLTFPFYIYFFYCKKSGFLINVSTRMNIKKYILINYFEGFAGSAVSMFIISIVGYLVCIVLFYPFLGESLPAAIAFKGWFFAPLFDFNIPLAGIVISFWRSILSTLFYSFGFIVMLYTKNIFIATSAPFIYSLVENYITGMLGCPQNSICTSFHPIRMGAFMVSPFNIMIGPLLLAIVNLILVLLLIVKKKRHGVWLDII